MSSGPGRHHKRLVDPKMKAVRFPWHWEAPLTDAMELVPLKPFSREAQAVAGRLQEEMGASGMDVEVLDVSRCQNKQLLVTYDLERTRVAAECGDGNCNERWLWHGTDALDSVITDGFNLIAYASMAFNAYGFGNYFAPDAKLSDFFIRSARGGSSGEKKLILARVCCGKIADKTHLKRLLPAGTPQHRLPNGEMNEKWQLEMRKLLAKPEHRQPPAGHHSVTGAGKHTEAVVFKDTMAYSAYVVTYKTPGGSLPDPYQQGAGYLKTMEEAAAWKLPGK